MDHGRHALGERVGDPRLEPQPVMLDVGRPGAQAIVAGAGAPRRLVVIGAYQRMHVAIASASRRPSSPCPTAGRAGQQYIPIRRGSRERALNPSWHRGPRARPKSPHTGERGRRPTRRCPAPTRRRRLERTISTCSPRRPTWSAARTNGRPLEREHHLRLENGEPWEPCAARSGSASNLTLPASRAAHRVAGRAQRLLPSGRLRRAGLPADAQVAIRQEIAGVTTPPMTATPRRRRSASAFTMPTSSRSPCSAGDRPDQQGRVAGVCAARRGDGRRDRRESCRRSSPGSSTAA